MGKLTADVVGNMKFENIHLIISIKLKLGILVFT